MKSICLSNSCSDEGCSNKRTVTNPPNFCWTTVNTLPKVGQALKQRCQCISNRFNLEGLVQQKPALIVLFHFIPIDQSQILQSCSFNTDCQWTSKSVVDAHKNVLSTGISTVRKSWQDVSRGICQPNSQPWHPQLELFSGEFAAYRFIAWNLVTSKRGKTWTITFYRSFVTNSVFYWVVGSTQIVVNKKIIFPKINMGKNCLKSRVTTRI